MAAPAGKRQQGESASGAPPKRSRAQDDGPWKLHLPSDFYTKHNIQPEATAMLKQIWDDIQKRNQNEWNALAWLGSPLSYEEVIAHVGAERAARLNWVGLWDATTVAKHRGKRYWGEQDENGEPIPAPAAFFFAKARLVDEEDDPDVPSKKRDVVTEVSLEDSVELNTQPVFHLQIRMFVADIYGEMYLVGRWYYKPLETFIAVTRKVVAAPAQPEQGGDAAKGKKTQQAQQEEDTAADDGTAEAERVAEAAPPTGPPRKAAARSRGKGKQAQEEKALPVEQEYMDSRRVWVVSDKDDRTWNNLHLVNSISKKVVVKHVTPGDPAPPVGSCDFWFDQSHDRMFCTFEDCYPGSTEAHRIQKQQELAKQEKPVLRVLEFFAGAGGLSFMAQSNPDAEIRGCWSVDVWDDACATYQANNPECEVFCLGIDEFLMLCYLFRDLSEKFPPTWQGEDKADKDKLKVISIEEISISVDAARDKKGQLKEELSRDQCQLIFHCTLDGHLKKELTEEDLAGNENMLFKFVQRIRYTKTIPQPGDVDVLTGGPPCQNISGLNRHAKQSDVLADPKNRLVQAYYEAIKFFRPKYTLMEQVQGIILKEKGKYIKFFVSMLLHLRYQVRIAVIAAGDFGCAQGRFRVFTWGARSGQVQLPPFPEPTHRCLHFKTPVGAEGQECRVGFLTEENRKNARDMTLLGDVCGDLPPVDNFCFTDYSDYATPPQTPQQLWFRRQPRPGMATLLERFHYAEGCDKYPIGEGRELHQKLVLTAFKTEGVVGLGCHYLCHTAFGSEDKSFYTQTWNVEIGEEKDANRLAQKLQERHANRVGSVAMMGMQVHAGAAAATKLEGQVRSMRKAVDENLQRQEAGGEAKEVEFGHVLKDHRPLICNSDDYMRMCYVGKTDSSSFFDWPGVCTNPDGTVCAGHYHAPRKANKRGLKGCLGGGTSDAIRRSNHKSTRVDQHDKDGWRGTSLQGCPSYTVWLPSGAALCPRWCLTYKQGKQSEFGSSNVCYGRYSLAAFPTTVVGRAEPHNRTILHPTQDRVMSIRENARCQGFPDYYVFCALYRNGDWRAGASLRSRYQQIGNAVAPPVASALGRCLLMAAAWKVPHEQPIVAVPDPEFEKVMTRAEELGLRTYYHQTYGHLPRQLHPVTKCSVISDNKPKSRDGELTVPPEERAEMYDAEEDDGEAWPDEE